ncbi:MAG TPA: RnfABCDGE type electron transport complex subunit G [Bacteroidales bacterium]|nr:RnfABCDGE type electron transport complex subunit G [Bacteroidales bacterium]
MAKMQSTLKNMVLSLTMVSLGASAALGYVYEFTKEPIEISKLNKKLNAIKQVVPEFTNNPNDEMFLLPTGEGDSLEVYPARNGEELVGYAIKSFTNKGFSGYIGFMVGFRPDGTIYNINVLEQKETPGLGSKMVPEGTADKPAFKDQFKDKDPAAFALKVKKDGGTVDAITAATISSRAFCDGVQRAYNAFEKGGLK